MQAEETNGLLDSAVDMDQMIVVETELLEDSLDHGGRFGPQLKKIKNHAVRNAELLGTLHERLRVVTNLKKS